MTTFYIAANLSRSLAYALGDSITLVKVANLFADSVPHDELLLSLDADEPFNFLFDRFIRERQATVLTDHWRKNTAAAHFAAFDERRRTRVVQGRTFDLYRELSPRLDGTTRQTALCGAERGRFARNIFEYYLLGQEGGCNDESRRLPAEALAFKPDLIDVPAVKRRQDRAVFIAPHENCQGNRIFTLRFWEEVCDRLLAADVGVTANDRGGFHPTCHDSRLARTFLPYRELLRQVAGERLVLCGNTGAGWVAAALGTPLLACERDMNFPEYGFARCGCTSLVGVIDEPDAEYVASTAIEFLERDSSLVTTPP